jgi:P27 family predicted phage terminase small subunit
MGRRGPRPLPVEVHRRRGTARADRLPATPIEFPKASGRAPDWITGDALEAWNALAPTLRSQGLLTRPDLPLFGALCLTIENVIELARAGRAVGLDESIRRGYRKAAIAERAALRTLAAEFGLSPSSRARVPADPAPAAPVSRWAGLIEPRPRVRAASAIRPEVDV